MNADHRGALEVQLDCVKDISESGRGLAIIQEVMDSSEYTPGTERNRFRMMKRCGLCQRAARSLTTKQASPCELSQEFPSPKKDQPT